MPGIPRPRRGACPLVLFALLLLLLVPVFSWGAAPAARGEAGLTSDMSGGTREDTTDVVTEVSPVTLTLVRDGHTLRVPYYGNRTLGTIYPGVTRAILVLNGTLRNADEYYASVLHAGQTAGGADAVTFIIAPQFLTEPDIEAHGLGSTYAFWAYMGWRRGNNSLNTIHHPRPATVSSFAVADTILARLAATLPDLEQVVIAGHSAGGQFSNLYTAGTGIHALLEQAYGIAVRSIVANPSCYIYMNAERWIEGTAYEYAVPSADVIADCPTYDDYKYGVNHPNEYMSVGADTLRARAGRREVAYLLGQQDINPFDFYLDRGCEAMLQGAYRLQRGLVYIHHLTRFFGQGIWDRQHWAVVPGVGHDQDGMFNSSCGLFYLYDYGSCDPATLNDWQDVTPSLLFASSSYAAAWGDFNGDGRDDLFLPATDAGDILAENLGDGVFGDATVPPLADPAPARGACWGDYDNDGRPDLYVIHWRSSNRLYRNLGGGAFADVTAGPLGLNGDCTGVSWVDYDLDGDLDLYITRTNSQSCVLLRNDGASGFADASASPVNLSGAVRCAAWGDYDGDGDPDLFVAKDGADKLFRNNGAGFTDVTTGPLGDNGSGSSAAWADYDNDGDLDLYIVNRTGPNHLLRNDGDGFTSVSGEINDMGHGRSASWGDYDRDGWLDVYLSNDGDVNRLFHNEAGTFTDVAAEPIDVRATSYSSAWADYDGDGDLDLFLNMYNSPDHLFRQESDPGRHWCRILLSPTESNGSAVGARLRLLAEGQWQTREIGGDAGALAQNAPGAFFGLAGATTVDSLVIRWPSGIVQRLWSLDVDQTLTVVESDVPLAAPESPHALSLDLSAAPNPFRGGTVLSYRLPQAGGVLEIVDPAGRVLRRCSRVRGSGAWSWDGRDGEGRSVPPGVYLGVVRGAGGRRAARLVLLGAPR